MESTLHPSKLERSALAPGRATVAWEQVRSIMKPHSFIHPSTYLLIYLLNTYHEPGPVSGSLLLCKIEVIIIQRMVMASGHFFPPSVLKLYAVWKVKVRDSCRKPSWVYFLPLHIIAVTQLQLSFCSTKTFFEYLWLVAVALREGWANDVEGNVWQPRVRSLFHPFSPGPDSLLCSPHIWFGQWIQTNHPLVGWCTLSVS